MTIVKRIQEWLQGNRLDHQEAIAIYQVAGGPYPYTHFAAYMESPFLPESIEGQLEEIFLAYLEEHPEEEEEEIEDVEYVKGEAWKSIQFEHKQDTKQVLVPTKEPEEIIRLREKGKRHMKEQSFFHSQLSTVETDKERYAIADKLMKEIVPNIDRVYDAIREYEETGEVPVMAAPGSLKEKIIELISKKASLTSRVSRLKGKLKGNLSPEQKAKYDKELLEKQHALLEIEKELE